MILLLMLLCADWKVPLADLSIYPVSAPSAAVSPDNVLCIADNTNFQIAFLDANGKLIAKKGAKGQGPEEFLRLDMISYVPEMNAFGVRDSEQDRISFWKTDGSFIKSVKLAHWHTMHPINDADGIRVDNIRHNGNPFNPTAYQTGLGDQEGKAIWSGALTVKNTGILANPKGWHSRSRFPWARKVRSAMTKDTLAISDFGGEKVTFVNIKTGKEIATITPGFEKRPISEAHLEAEAEKVFEYYRHSDPHFKDRMIRLAMETYTAPEQYPPVMDLVADGKGRIWVFGPSVKDDKVPYEVYDNGKQVGSGKLDHQPAIISKDTLYVITHSKSDSEDYFIQSGSLPNGL